MAGCHPSRRGIKLFLIFNLIFCCFGYLAWFLSNDMVRLSPAWASSLVYALSASNIVLGQSSTATNSADGLSSGAASSTLTASPTVGTSLVNGTATTYSVPFTVPAAADVGMNILPTIYDPEAKDAQEICPGYTASNVQHTLNGFTATLTLAGKAVSMKHLALLGHP